jgi:hypothetical protein
MASNSSLSCAGRSIPRLVNPKEGVAVTVRIDSDALEKAESGVGTADAEAGARSKVLSGWVGGALGGRPRVCSSP